jgi:hypothetical protein
MMPHPTLIAQRAVAPTYSLSLSPTFGWLLCLSIEWRGHLRPRDRSSLYFDFSVAQFDVQNDRTMSHPIHITQRTVDPTYKFIAVANFWLVVVSLHQVAAI